MGNSMILKYILFLVHKIVMMAGPKARLSAGCSRAEGPGAETRYEYPLGYGGFRYLPNGRQRVSVPFLQCQTSDAGES